MHVSILKSKGYLILHQPGEQNYLPFKHLIQQIILLYILCKKLLYK